MLHCKDCKHWTGDHKDFNQCAIKHMTTGSNNFCNDAEPRVEKPVETKKARVKK